MEDIIDIIVTETTNLIEITSQPTDEIIDVNIIDNREDVTLNVTPTVVEININSLTGNFGVNWGEIDGTLSNQTDLQNALNLKADLVDGKVPSSQLPSYVDDVVEVANYAALPVTGEVGKIYITLDTNYIYRWSGSAYIEIKDSSAVWGAITGTLSNQTDLQNALNAKANDNAVVHLAGTETITGAKTFSSAVTAPNFVLSGGTGNTGLYYGHTDRVVLANYTTGGIDFEVNGGSIVATLFPSGNYGLGITLDAGYKLDVNGTARISGALSGTSASFSSSITASSIIKSGGTSSQFLKADGSVDSTSYQPLLTNPVTGTGTSGIVAVFNGTSSITDSSIYANSTRVSIGADVTTTNRFTAVSSTTSAYAVVAQASSAAHGIWSNVLGTGEIFRGQTAGGSYFIINNGGNAFLNGNLNVGDFASTSYRLNVVGTANLTGALSGTSATFSDTITSTLAGQSARGLYFTANQPSGINWYDTDDVEQYSVGIIANSGSGYWGVWSSTSSTAIDRSVAIPKFKIANSGAATFSSSVTATLMGVGISSLSSWGSPFSVTQYPYGSYSGGTTSGAWVAGNNNYYDGSNYRYVVSDYASLLTQGGGDFYIRTATTGTAGNVITWNERFRVTNSGNVGIGTTAPQRLLDARGAVNLSTTSPSVSSTSGAYADIHLRTWSGATSSPARITILDNWMDYFATYTDGHRFRNWSSDGVTRDLMTITGSGNVGIGTTSPTDILHLAKSGTGVYNAIHYTNTNSTADFYVGIGGSSVPNAGLQNNAYLYNAGNSAIVIATNDTERMRITSSGNVGIGNTTGPEKLSVNGNLILLSGYQIYGNSNSGSTSSYLSMYNGTDGGIDLMANYTTSKITFGTAGSERMRINSAGNVGIGTTSPMTFGGFTNLTIASSTTTNQAALFLVNSNTTIRGSFYTNGNSNVRIGTATSHDFLFDTADTERMRITSAGHALFGTTGTSWQTTAGTYIFFQSALNTTRDGAEAMNLNRLTSNGDLVKFYQGGTNVGSISVTSVMTSYNVTSDYRLKEDLKPINGLDIVNKIKVYDYKWKADNSRMDGVLAHELQEVLPYAVTGVKDGEQMQSVDYSKIVPVLIQAIKDQQVQIEQLKNK